MSRSTQHIDNASGSLDRRNFLKGMIVSTATIAAAGTLVGLTAPPAMADSPAISKKGALTGQPRKARAAAIRHKAAIRNTTKVPAVTSPLTNGDEVAYANRINQFSKGLIHTSLGEVDVAAYSAYLAALKSGEMAQIETLTLGCANPASQRKLRNPLAGLAFDTEGVDCAQSTMPAPPAFASAWAAGEAVELYWMALLRDVNFADYAGTAQAAIAASELSNLTDFRGPLKGGLVTSSTLFRDAYPGCLTGPYVSQFLLKSVPYGSQVIDAKQRTVLASADYAATLTGWKDMMDGRAPSLTDQVDSQLRYIRNGRDLTAWVHVDVAYQAFLLAALALSNRPDASDSWTGGGFGAPQSASNPYVSAVNQDAFVTFGPVDLFVLLAEVASRAMKACWHQKWYVHRRARPEEYCGRVRQHKQALASYPLHGDVLNSQALAATLTTSGDYFLPQAFPEGSPMHPSYPSGHATISGACATVLKAFFDESFVLSSPKVASSDGLSLVNYSGLDAGEITVGGEINKLASNLATGRNIAGIHWRSDGQEGIKLGEQVAMTVLRDYKDTYAEDFQGFTFTKFDATTAVI